MELAVSIGFAPPHRPPRAAKTGGLSEAWTNIDEAAKAIETTKERWHDAELSRVAGEIALMSSEPDAAKAEAYFARALEVARRQLARSWELRAATSMARAIARSAQAGRSA